MNTNEVLNKLKAEIERRKIEWKALFDGGENTAAKECFYEDENILDIITSLQQEQPEPPKREMAEYYYHKGVYEGLSQGRADALKILEEFMKRKADPVIVIKQQEQPDGLHFTPLNRLIQKIPSENWNDTVNNYAKKLRDCFIKEGYRKDAEVLQGYISYMNGNNIPMATMDGQERQEPFSCGHENGSEPKPEVELEKEFSREYATYHLPDFILGTLCDGMGVIDFIYKTARHFYELGLKAGKEE